MCFSSRAHELAEGGVEIRQRLVEQEDRWLDDGGAADRQLLQLVDAELARRLVETIRQAA